MPFESIPLELQLLPQWLCWRYEEGDGKKPTKIPYNVLTGQYASVSDPATWTSFENVLAAFATGNYSGIGFVFTENDPYAFIDLDDCEGDKSILERQLKIFEQFNSYSEKSPSGTGLHIICKGSLKSGRKKFAVEIYTWGRYATFTGDVYLNRPIEDRTELLQSLYDAIGGNPTTYNIYEGDENEKYPDSEIISRALAAVNGDKFKLLLDGNWVDIYPTQSEADLAFINIIAFYTQNRTQIARIFRASRLGQRTKAQRNDYVLWMINKSFDRLTPKVDIDGLRNAIETTIAQSKTDRTQLELFATGPGNIPAPDIMVYPPGLLGDIAKFIYEASPRAVHEIALTAAIGLMAGITGRAYNVSQMGLNQYILLLAGTGTGKEAMATAINKLMASIRMQVPAATAFMGPGKIASNAALLKYIAKKSPCFVSVVGEFGLTMQDITARNANPAQRGLRQILLDIYNKSGKDQIMYPSIYSDSDKTTEAVSSPSITLLGETAPETFYNALNESMLVDGFLPRWLIIEYSGKRMHLSKTHEFAVPSHQLSDQLATLCGHCLTLMHRGKVIELQFDKDAAELMDVFDRHATDMINSFDKENMKHLWNRAHVKALKLAALVAIGINPYEPAISLTTAEWALGIVQRDTNALIKRFERGEVGKDSEETKQISKVVKAMAIYVKSPIGDVVSYGAKHNLHNDKIISSSYIQRRLGADGAFRDDRLGATNAIKRTIQTLIDNGDIREVGKNDLSTKYGFSGRAFVIVNQNMLES